MNVLTLFVKILRIFSSCLYILWFFFSKKKLQLFFITICDIFTLEVLRFFERKIKICSGNIVKSFSSPPPKKKKIQNFSFGGFFFFTFLKIPTWSSKSELCLLSDCWRKKIQAEMSVLMFGCLSGLSGVRVHACRVVPLEEFSRVRGIFSMRIDLSVSAEIWAEEAERQGAEKLHGPAAVTGGEEIWIRLRDRCRAETESRLMD